MSVAHKTVLSHDQDRYNPLIAEKGEQLMHVQYEGVLLGHGGDVAVETVNHHHAGTCRDFTPDTIDELARRHRGGADVRPGELLRGSDTIDVHSQTFGAVCGYAVWLLKCEHGGALAPIRRRSRQVHSAAGLSYAGGNNKERAGSPAKCMTRRASSLGFSLEMGSGGRAALCWEATRLGKT